jgi:lipopolysaccharide/colanic/teichoic acid biosynthesis glycosyltransferase
MNIELLYNIVSLVAGLLGAGAIFVLLKNASMKRNLASIENIILDIEEYAKVLSSKKISYYMKLRPVFDFIFGLGVIIFLLPIFVIFILLQVLTSKGPLFTYETRIGQFGKKVRLRKFRTTYHTENEESNINLTKYTQFGKFLKKYDFDGLPLYFSLLNGDLSLIGRSKCLDIPEISNKLSKQVTEILYFLKPGIISFWSVTISKINSRIEDMPECDLYYYEKVSIVFDLKIFFRAIAIASGITQVINKKVIRTL